ncbi:MAG: ethanolamine ammonia-lyase subunit EutB [Pararobbsia sp.]
MYFETGQGSALSADAHHGVDQQTCEARAYAVRARVPALAPSTRSWVSSVGVLCTTASRSSRAGARGTTSAAAARRADGLRHLLHEPRGCRSGRHGQPAHAARGPRPPPRRQFHHGRARRGRHHAQTTRAPRFTTRSMRGAC